jgi:hypothetical protein
MPELFLDLQDGANPTLSAVAARAGVSPITVSRLVRTPDNRDSRPGRDRSCGDA